MTTPILMYHSVGERVPPGFAPWVVHPHRFRHQMSYLAGAGYETLTVRDLVRRRRAGGSPRRAVALTFDDGFADFLHNAVPILHAFNMTATLFVTTGFLGGTFRGLPVLDWGELAAIRDGGIEIGSHTVSHTALDRLAPARVLAELQGSKLLLEDRLGVAVDSFAYPFGFQTSETRQAVIAAGYAAACAVGYAFSRHDDDPFALRRMFVSQHDTRLNRLPPRARLYRARSRGWAWMRRSLTQVVGYEA